MADVLVLGAGPAGVQAALAAAAAGLGVTLVDEAGEAGGQVYRTIAQRAAPGFEAATGDVMRRALAGSTVDHLRSHRAWTVSRAPLRVAVAGPQGTRMLQPRALVVATGATERVVPFPGWTLPGVMGLAATTVLLKSRGAVPRAPAVVAGCGPLLVAVAAAILKAGGQVAAVVDAHGPGDWLACVPGMCARPDLFARGVGWTLRLRRAGVPVLFRHRIAFAEGGDSVEAVRVEPIAGVPLRSGAAQMLAARSVAVGHGLIPGLDVLRLLGAVTEYRADAGGWCPVLDAHGRTSIPHVYAAGDGAGIRGVAAAELAGRLAGLTAAYDLGALSAAAFGTVSRGLKRRLTRAQRFGAAMGRLMNPPPGLVAAIPFETVVCRCEDVTRGEVDASMAAGAMDLDQIKTRTRCGMGPCQGRICGSTAASLAAIYMGTEPPPHTWTVRPPLRPLTVGELVGTFDYADIPPEQPAH